ncbi:hypothetical protein ACJMK2_038389 [Sinanodonta woodiana]|uniref:Beta-hexosaminidase n=1 Tax=Sinanodonta woodiana TaxID=1069815 RepID=A0ABD3WC31_SINWO
MATLTFPIFFLMAILPFSEGYLTYIAARLPLKGFRAAPGAPWPMPKEWTNFTEQFTVDPKTFSIVHDVDCDILVAAEKRYQDLLFGKQSGRKTPSLKQVEKLHITSGKCEKYPSIDSNESYVLKVSPGIALLESSAVWGALRGLETFSQLLYIDSNNEFKINATIIVDSPRFQHRGLMLDTARHYLAVDTILANLDAMAYNKFNVFHWHIVDDQSFPYVSEEFPALSRKGAYGPNLVYTKGDIRKIIEYARLRGIRVIPEFDTPGHTQSWGRALKDFLTPCYGDGKNPGTANYTSHAEFEIVNPILNSTYDVIHKLFSEVKKDFPDQYLHLGMDEAYRACWATNPEIKNFMTSNGFGSNFTLLEHLSTKIIIWHDPVDNGAEVGNDTIVQIWKDSSFDPNKFKPGHEYLSKVVKKGYKTIFSACWYLNYISYGQDWRKRYECEPLDFAGSEDDHSRVIGGEACIWAEYVDETNLLSRLWPRASAVAERLWSPRHVKDIDSAAFRLDQQRCRMLRRGIPAEPILNGYCEQVDWKADTNPAVSAAESTKATKPCFAFFIVTVYIYSQ